MKLRTIFIVLLVFYVTLTMPVLGAAQSEDDFGKLVGQILDAETRQHVDEIFSVFIYDSWDASSRGNFRELRSDKNGKFERDLAPGTYYLDVSPFSISSKYCIDLYPNEIGKTKIQPIIIKKGQIVKFFKIAKYGGKLLIKCVDRYDNPVNFRSSFGDDAGVSVYFGLNNHIVDSDNPGVFKCYYPNLKDNELMFLRLRPGKLDVNIKCTGMGYGKIDVKNIEITSKSVLEIKYIIDWEDRTGIEGVVTDALGVPIPNASVAIFYKDRKKICSYVDVFTAKNGYYKMVGLSEGKVRIEVTKDLEHSILTDTIPGDVIMISNTIIKKNIKFKFKL